MIHLITMASNNPFIVDLTKSFEIFDDKNYLS